MNAKGGRDVFGAMSADPSRDLGNTKNGYLEVRSRIANFAFKIDGDKSDTLHIFCLFLGSSNGYTHLLASLGICSGAESIE